MPPRTNPNYTLVNTTLTYKPTNFHWTLQPKYPSTNITTLEDSRRCNNPSNPQKNEVTLATRNTPKQPDPSVIKQQIQTQALINHKQPCNQHPKIHTHETHLVKPTCDKQVIYALCCHTTNRLSQNQIVHKIPQMEPNHSTALHLHYGSTVIFQHTPQCQNNYPNTQVKKPKHLSQRKTPALIHRPTEKSAHKPSTAQSILCSCPILRKHTHLTNPKPSSATPYIAPSSIRSRSRRLYSHPQSGMRPQNPSNMITHHKIAQLRSTKTFNTLAARKSPYQGYIPQRTQVQKPNGTTNISQHYTTKRPTNTTNPEGLKPTT
eukprot:gene3104-2086_t